MRCQFVHQSLSIHLPFVFNSISLPSTLLSLYSNSTFLSEYHPPPLTEKNALINAALVYKQMKHTFQFVFNFSQQLKPASPPLPFQVSDVSPGELPPFRDYPKWHLKIPLQTNIIIVVIHTYFVILSSPI